MWNKSLRANKKALAEMLENPNMDQQTYQRLLLNTAILQEKAEKEAQERAVFIGFIIFVLGMSISTSIWGVAGFCISGMVLGAICGIFALC
jgi:hypothetical protein